MGLTCTVTNVAASDLRKRTSGRFRSEAESAVDKIRRLADVSALQGALGSPWEVREMSAFVVSKEHIDALVSTAVFGPKGSRRLGGGWHAPYDPDTGEMLTEQDADRIGTELWSENVRSVAYRYPQDGNGERPGPCSFRDEHAFGYIFPMTTRPLGAIAALKAIRCLEYQSCEHPDWEASWAKRFLDSLTDWLTPEIPGYEEADWEVEVAESF